MCGDSGANRTEPRAVALCLAFVCALTLVAYSRSFHAAFQFDDNNHVVHNPVFEDPTLESVLRFGRARLLPVATLFLNHRLGGDDPFGYHVVNFAIHLLATCAVFALALTLCRTPRLSGSSLAEHRLAFATAAALVFACHPIQVQAVTYIVQRISAMAALFYVGSVLFYLRARNAGLGLGSGRPIASYAASALLALAAFFSKENAASLPLAILASEVAFYPGPRRARRLLRLLPFALLVLTIPLTWKALGRRPGAERFDAPLAQQTQDLVSYLVLRASHGVEITSVEYLMTQAVVIPRYLRLVVVPWGFNVDHDVPIARELSLPVLAGAAALIALFACGLYALRRAPVVGFAILWLFVALSIESSILPIRDVMVEHRMYLAMPGIALAAGAGFASVLRRNRRLALAGAALCGALLVALTFARNEVWRSPLSLWQDALAKSPSKPRVHVNMGTALNRLGRADEAIAHYCKALSLDPDYRMARINLDRAMEEKVERMAEEGQDVEMVAVIGADGQMQVRPADPCTAEDPAS
jgi:tetratricopeptide (TPR) repeat protein